MQERAVRTRRAILSAARDEFAGKGFHGARIDAIAARARVNKQRIYANFRSKAGLFAAVLETAFADMSAEERRLLELGAADIPRLAERVLECYVGLHEHQPAFWRLLAWENLDGGRHSAGIAGHKDPVLKHLRRLYRAGQADGHFRRDVSFEGFVCTLLAVSYFMFSNRHTLKRSIGIDFSRAGARAAVCRAVARQMGLSGR